MAKKKYYAVVRGNTPGIYTKWFGSDGAEIQVRGFPKALYKGFATRKDAEDWLQNPVSTGGVRKKKQARQADKESPADTPVKSDVVIYTDGGCMRNPGPGGYGAVLIHGENREELSDGFRLTTNNRMELMACIVALKALPKPYSIALHSDSKYVVNGISKGWAKRWRSNNWMRNKTESAINADLWGQLLDLCEFHKVSFIWVKGHAGNPENECCDQLATQAALRDNLPPDTLYEKGETMLA